MMGDLLLESLTALGSMIGAKVMSMGASISQGLSQMKNPITAMKNKIGEAISPSKGPSKEKSSGPAQDRSPAKAPEVPGPSKTQQYENLIGDMKLDAKSMGIEATDLGNVSVDYGCADHSIPRATAMQQEQAQEHAMMMQR